SEAPDGRRPLVAVELQVLPRKLSLPGVRRRPALGKVLVTPREPSFVETSTRRTLPFGLARKLFPRPRRVRLRILVGDVHDGTPVAAADGRSRPTGALPVRARHVTPRP